MNKSDIQYHMENIVAEVRDLESDIEARDAIKKLAEAMDVELPGAEVDPREQRARAAVLSGHYERARREYQLLAFETHDPELSCGHDHQDHPSEEAT